MLVNKLEKKFFNTDFFFHFLNFFWQWFSMKRKHAVITVADTLYYSKFRDFCKVKNRKIIKKINLTWMILILIVIVIVIVIACS